MSDYKKTIEVAKPIEEVYKAITIGIPDWWTNDFSGLASAIGDTFIVSFNKTTKTFEIADSVVNDHIIWLCTKAYIDMKTLSKKDEWEGTKLFWSLTPTNSGTKISFIHEGLTPAFECYNVCEDGWNYFLKSLEAYLNTEKGTPHLKKG